MAKNQKPNVPEKVAPAEGENTPSVAAAAQDSAAAEAVAEAAAQAAAEVAAEAAAAAEETDADPRGEVRMVNGVKLFVKG